MSQEKKNHNKRRRDHPGAWSRRKPQNKPRRGGPAMLLTCDTSRDARCRREGIEILKYYLNNAPSSNTNHPTAAAPAELSLDEEIAMVRQENKIGGKSNTPNPFQVYDTGVRGTVFVMCAIANCALIPPIKGPEPTTEKEDTTLGDKRKGNNDEETSNKKARVNDEIDNAKNAEGDNAKNTDDNKIDSSSSLVGTTDPPWDPLITFEKVLKDRTDASSTAPSSRFVTRMIPIQATCFASVEEIKLTAKALIDKYIRTTKPSTFMVAVKRRNCSNVTRDEIIQNIAKLFTDDWKVQLKNPEYTLHVEVVKTLCGISVIRNCHAYGNFNLHELKESHQETITNSSSKKD